MKRGRRERPDAVDDGVRDRRRSRQDRRAPARDRTRRPRASTASKRLEIGVDVADDEISIKSQSTPGCARRFREPAATHRCDVRLAVGGLPPREELFHLRRDRTPGAAGRRRARARSPARAGTSSHATAPSASIAARLSGSTNVPPPVATITCRCGQQLLEDRAFDAAEIRLAVAGEDVGDAPALARLDAGDRCLPRASPCGGRARVRRWSCPRP